MNMNYAHVQAEGNRWTCISRAVVWQEASVRQRDDECCTPLQGSGLAVPLSASSAPLLSLFLSNISEAAFSL